MKKFLFTAVAMGSLIVPALGGAQNPTTAPKQMDMGMMQSCPMSVKGAEVASVNTRDGITITTITKSGDVADLRRRVDSMAKMHTAASNQAMMKEHMIPFAAKYEDVAGGARVTLTPNDPSRLEEFRTKVREHAQRMKTGDCSMMQDMMKGMKTPEAKVAPKPEDADHSAHHPEGEKK